MQRIPDTVFSFPSTGERRVFELLGKVDLGPDWRAYHSLNCSEHEYKQWAEIDFLLLGPEGGLVLEVKAGRISRREGAWRYRDRWGRENMSTEGPFNQAKSAMFSLQRMLEDQYPLDHDLRVRIPFGWGVVMPDVDWTTDTPETPPEVVADRTRVASAAAFRRYLKSLLDYWKRKLKRWPTLSKADLVELHSRIRPDVDLYPPLTLRIGDALDRMQSLTDEQYERLELIEQNERAIISGGAGTGKTYLLMQSARREAARGRSVVVTVHSPILARWLQALESTNEVKIVTPEGLSTEREPFDVVMVDEGQDLLDFEFLAVVSEAVRGGLDYGRWRWFMDDANQAGIAGRASEEAREFLLSGLASGSPARVPLVNNVRNTVEVAHSVYTWTGVDIGRAKVMGHGRGPELVVANDDDELVRLLEGTLNDLLDEGIAPDEVALILPIDGDPNFLDRLPRNLRRRLVPLDGQTATGRLRGRILWGTVDRFKGLERPVILCVGFDDADFAGRRVSELYVASTRANFGLTVFTSEPTAKRLRSNPSGQLPMEADRGVE